MQNFKINQIVLCELRVTYSVIAENHEAALKIIAEIDSPSCAHGRDFEILSDKEILSTKIEGA